MDTGRVHPETRAGDPATEPPRLRTLAPLEDRYRNEIMDVDERQEVWDAIVRARRALG